MKKAIFLTIILGLAICEGAVYAQEAQAPAPERGPAAQEVQEAYGEVVSVDAKACAITITEYDYDKDEDVDKAYTIDKAAAYENVKSLAEIVVGDWVALTLKPQADGKNVATSVYVERYDLGEEAPPAPNPAPAPEVITPAPELGPAAPAEDEPAEPVEEEPIK